MIENYHTIEKFTVMTLRFFRNRRARLFVKEEDVEAHIEGFRG